MRSMAPKRSHVQDGKKGAVIRIRVMPRSSQNRIVEILGDGTVKIHLTAPPVEGKANLALLKFLAKVLDVPISHLEIVSGASGREKLVSVIEMDAEILHREILEHIG
jgi:uncharacterized protein (TIGR00251 family)